MTITPIIALWLLCSFAFCLRLCKTAARPVPNDTLPRRNVAIRRPLAPALTRAALVVGVAFLVTSCATTNQVPRENSSPSLLHQSGGKGGASELMRR